jgi:hypothetical protein
LPLSEHGTAISPCKRSGPRGILTTQWFKTKVRLLQHCRRMMYGNSIEMDDIRDGEHPNKYRFLAVPEGGRTTPGTSQVGAQSDITCVPTIKEKTLESFLYLWLRIEDDNTKADGEGVMCELNRERRLLVPLTRPLTQPLSSSLPSTQTMESLPMTPFSRS